MSYLKSIVTNEHEPKRMRNSIAFLEKSPGLGPLSHPKADRHSQITCRLGDGACAKAHASTLERSTKFQSNGSQQAVLRLQQNFGNRFVGRVLGLARKRDSDCEFCADETISLPSIVRSGNGNEAMEVSPEVEHTIARSRGGGQALDSKVRVQMESAFGVNFNAVRIHTSETADRLNRTLNARAFTVGRDVFFRQGEYQPASSSGRELLAHELTHVCQQSGKHAQSKLKVSHPNERYEREADHIAESVVRMIDSPDFAPGTNQPDLPGHEKQKSYRDANENITRQPFAEDQEEEDSVQLQEIPEEEDEKKPVAVQTKLIGSSHFTAGDSQIIQPRLRQIYFVTDRPRETDSTRTVNSAYLNQSFTTPAYLAETRGLSEGNAISIIGRASKEAPSSLSEDEQRRYNLSLSNRRAISVRNYLQDTGNPPTIRSLTPLGDRGAESNIAFWRRVDIEIPEPDGDVEEVQRAGCSHPAELDLSTITAPRIGAIGPRPRFDLPWPLGTVTGNRSSHRRRSDLRRSFIFGDDCECVDVASYRIEIYDIPWNANEYVHVHMSLRRRCCSTEPGSSLNQACRGIPVGFSFEETHSHGEYFLFDPSGSSDRDLLSDVGAGASILGLVLAAIAIAIPGVPPPP